MFDVELKHTWHVSRVAWYIRLYLWVWDQQPQDLTFCKLWWGYVFMWLGLPIKSLIVAIGKLVRTLDKATIIALGFIFKAGRSIHRRWIRFLIYETEVAPVREIVVSNTSSISPYALMPRGPSVLGDWLRSLRHRRPLQPYERPVASVEGDTVITTPPMARLLNHVAYMGAWAGMQKQRVAWGLKRIAKWTVVPLALALGYFVIAIADAAEYVAPLVFGAVMTVAEFLVGSVIAIFAGVLVCLIQVGHVLAKLSPVFVIVGNVMSWVAKRLWTVIVVASWPLRKLAVVTTILPTRKLVKLFHLLDGLGTAIAIAITLPFWVGTFSWQP